MAIGMWDPERAVESTAMNSVNTKGLRPTLHHDVSISAKPMIMPLIDADRRAAVLAAPQPGNRNGIQPVTKGQCLRSVVQHAPVHELLRRAPQTMQPGKVGG